MNKLIIIGNLTRDPELRDVNGVELCTFTVAVNRRVKKDEHPQADYVRVSAWRQLGDLCAMYLAKGRKVAVVGPVRAHAYIDNHGDARASMEMQAEQVEFLSARQQAEEGEDGFTPVPEDEIPQF